MPLAYLLRNANITELADLTVGMLGTAWDESLKTKARETKYLMRYIADAAVKHERKMAPALAQQLISACTAMVCYTKLLDSSGRRLSDKETSD